MIIKHNSSIIKQEKISSTSNKSQNPKRSNLVSFFNQNNSVIQHKRKINYKYSYPIPFLTYDKYNILSNSYHDLLFQIYYEIEKTLILPEININIEEDIEEDTNFNFLVRRRGPKRKEENKPPANADEVIFSKDCENKNHKTGILAENFVDENNDVIKKPTLWADCDCYIEITSISALGLLGIGGARLWRALAKLHGGIWLKKIRKALSDINKKSEEINKGINDLQSLLKGQTAWRKDVEELDRLQEIYGIEEFIFATSKRFPSDVNTLITRLNTRENYLKILYKKYFKNSPDWNTNLPDIVGVNNRINIKSNIFNRSREAFVQLKKDEAIALKIAEKPDPGFIKQAAPWLYAKITELITGIKILSQKICGPKGVPFRRAIDPNRSGYAELNKETCECSICPDGKFLCKSKSILNAPGGFQDLFTGLDFEDVLSYCMDPCCGNSVRFHNPVTDFCGCACGEDITFGEVLQGGWQGPVTDGYFKPCDSGCSFSFTFGNRMGKCVSRQVEQIALSQGKVWSEEDCDFIVIENENPYEDPYS
jgi:hypothetical protein